jgi:hypothetical protein
LLIHQENFGTLEKQTFAKSLQWKNVGRGIFQVGRRPPQRPAKEIFMPILVYIAHFFGGVFLANGIPHFVSGVCGRSFRTPFVRMHGGDVSSPTVNVFWGWLNFLVAYLLFIDVGPRYLGSPFDTVAAAAGMLIMGLLLSRIFAGRPVA